MHAARGIRRVQQLHAKASNVACFSNTHIFEDTYEQVQKYYGKVLSSSKDLKTSACTSAERPHSEIRKIMCSIPSAIKDKFYGCGSPVPLGIDGRRILDLGSGSGVDCYVASVLVGETGFVTGVDMTQEQLKLSRDHVPAFCSKHGFAKPNMQFLEVATKQILSLSVLGIERSRYLAARLKHLIDKDLLCRLVAGGGILADPFLYNSL